MKHIFLAIGLFVPTIAFALDYNVDTLPYTDVTVDHRTQVAISTLTQLGIVRGNPDGTFKPNTPINRAEFMKIAMELLPPSTENLSLRCFPDVDPNIWFAGPVCRAKSLGIVSGNVQVGVDAHLWLFEPTRSVKYEEALKILSHIYDIPLAQSDSEQWYGQYTKTAVNLALELDDSAPGSSLTRGQMARLVTAYMAYARGELDELRYAQSHPFIPVRTDFGSKSSSSSSVAMMSSSSSAAMISSSSSQSSIVYDPNIDDVTSEGSVLILGQVTRVLGAATFFANSEPIIADTFVINLTTPNSSIRVLNIYDDRGALIGRASLDSSISGNTRYTLNVYNNNIILPHRESYSIYVRAELKSQDSGGVSGGVVGINSIGVEGVGYWSSRNYIVSTSGETFPQSSVAQSGFTEVSNAGSETDTLINGEHTEIGAFYIAGETGHSAAVLKVMSIVFQIEQIGGVTLSNPVMRVDGSSEEIACSIAGSQLTCSGLPDSFGRVDDGARTLRVFADIEIPSSTPNAKFALRLTINDPGTINSAGSITWSDGVTTFTWIDINRTPLARGTYYTR